MVSKPQHENSNRSASVAKLNVYASN